MYALDTPGALARGALGGEFGERLSGREMLENWNLLSENEEGLDWGDAAGFGAEMLIDPLALAGPVFGAFKGGQAAMKTAKAVGPDALAATAREVFPMAKGMQTGQHMMRPQYGKSSKAHADLYDVLQEHGIKNAAGEPELLTHGTGAVFDQFDPARAGSGAGGNLWGKGDAYLTNSNDISSTYAMNAFDRGGSYDAGRLAPEEIGQLRDYYLEDLMPTVGASTADFEKVESLSDSELLNFFRNDRYDDAEISDMFSKAYIPPNSNVRLQHLLSKKMFDTEANLSDSLPELQDMTLKSRFGSPEEKILSATHGGARAIKDMEKQRPGLLWRYTDPETNLQTGRINPEKTIDRIGKTLDNSQPGDSDYQQLTEWYNALSDQRLGSANKGENLGDVYRAIEYASGKEGSPNRILTDMGYDALKYPGGQATGGRIKHDAYVAFDANNVIPANPSNAQAETILQELLKNFQ
tara:strand:+ start:18039 stop:19439 length:1401 start_codon:yes stop_codon:yes gene_type:complete